MISYRINASLRDDKISFYTRAESCRQAVGKFILNMDGIFESDVITTCREVLADSVYDTESEFLVYESEDLKFDCSRITMIIPDKLDEEDPFAQTYEYVYMNLPPHLGNLLDAIDIGHILFYKEEYVDDHGFYLDNEGEPTGKNDEEAQLYYHPDEAAEFIYKSLDGIDEERVITLSRIKEILAVISEYELALKQAFKEPSNDPIHSIDISAISTN